jgi:predicted O-methyltransferase YrrM
MTPLCELAKKHGTDKGGEHLQRGDTCHNYTKTYFHLFDYRRHDVRNVLEIGIGGGHSLRMWKEFFSKAQIIGIDCNPECLAQTEDRIRCFHGDQRSSDDLMAIMDALERPKFDLIVDDGSHEPADQISTAQVLLPYLTPHGMYVIEDIEPDCKPELIGHAITKYAPYQWRAIPTGRGLGRAYCRCGCEGGENLVVIRRV